MQPLPTYLSEPRGAGVVLVGIGLWFFGIHATHAIDEITESLQAVVAGSLIPIVVSVFIIGSGVWVAYREWTEISPWRMVGWGVIGGITGAILIGLFIWYESTEGTIISHTTFVLYMFLTYGTAIGLIVARYDMHIQRTRSELMNRNRRLDEFANIVSHDLRNPLNVAAGYVDHAKETGDMSVLSKVEAAHARMETILGDMLTLTRSSETGLNLTGTDLARAAEESWAMVETPNATLNVTTNQQIRADPSRLKSVFENLFRNAIEHNEGSVTVHVGELGDGFFVEDSGSGIDPSVHDRVFEAGYSTGTGSGLGLAIVRAAVDAHGWSCVVTESESGGARFEFNGVQIAE